MLPQLVKVLRRFKSPADLHTRCARDLLSRYEPDLSKVCEPEDARQIWNEYLRLCHTSGATEQISLGAQATKTFAKFWQPRHLKVSPERHHHQLMPRLHLFGMTLTHLEVSAYWIKNLAWLHGTPNLQCLSLRQLCYLQPIQYRNFLAVPQLRALDLFEMARSEEPTGFELGVVLAALQNLKVLNVECTEVGDNLVETITFGRRLAAWSRETGQALSAEQASWPQTNICQLRLSRTNITPATLGFLTSLQELQLLDIRKTEQSSMCLQYSGGYQTSGPVDKRRSYHTSLLGLKTWVVLSSKTRSVTDRLQHPRANPFTGLRATYQSAVRHGVRLPVRLGTGPA
ncbi:hypothetical protein WJX79_000720 [Trebouxia sp. C0005]